MESYKTLRNKWYAKLKREGFDDIEHLDGRLKEWSATVIGNPKLVFTQSGGWEAKQQYYSMATQFLNEHKFSNKLTQAIWEYHSNGLSARSIAKLLKKAKIKTIGISKSNIAGILLELKQLMFKKHLK